MQLKITELVGSKVISIQEGQELAIVQDVVFDPNQQKIAAIVLDDNELFSARIIPFSSIKKFGNGLVMIKSNQDIKRADQVIKPINESPDTDPTFLQTDVITKDGKNLGKVVDLCFDTDTGQVEELEVGQTELAESEDKQIRVPDVVAIKEDKVVVKSEAEMQKKIPPNYVPIDDTDRGGNHEEQKVEASDPQHTKQDQPSEQKKSPVQEIIEGVKEQLGFK